MHSLNSCFVSLWEQTLGEGGRTLPNRWRGVLRRDGFHVPSSCNSAHVDRLPRERVFSGATGSPSTSRHPQPRLPGDFRRPPEGGARRGPRGGRADRPLPSVPYRAHAALHPGTREQSPRPRHARLTPRIGDPGAGATAAARPAEPFRLARSSADAVRYPPQRPSPWDLPRVPGSPHAGRGEPMQPP